MFLRAADPLPARPRRVLVAGTSGAGKTTLAGRVAGVLGVPQVELDALRHGPRWVPRPEFAAEVEAFSAGPAWVTEWQYAAVRPLLLARADLLVWLDVPRRVVLRRVAWRTLLRQLQGTELWNGNREPPLRTLLTDPEHVVRYACATHPRTAERVRQAVRDRPDLPVVRLRRGEPERWLAGPLAAAAQR